MKKAKLLILLILVIPSFIKAQKVDAEKAMKGFDKFVKKTMKDWNVPGLSIGIVQNGKVVYTKGYGYKNVEEKQAADENTLFAIGSSSKAFTAASVMNLADDDLIKLDEPVVEQMSGFKLHDDYATKTITPRDLLCHRSGLPRHDLAWYGSDKSRKELMNSLQYLEPTAQLRETWQYQNLMYMAAGVLVEETSGMSWEKYVATNFFQPLGMKRSNFSVEIMQKDENYALPYKEEDNEIKKMDFRNIDAVGPAGSINSSAVEMAEWVKLQLAEGKYGEEQLIASSSVAQMHTPHTIMTNGYKYDELFYQTYGLGWFITNYRSNLSVNHGGNIDGFSAMVALMPRKDFGVVILTNMNGTPLTAIIRNNIYDRFLGLDQIDWSGRVKESMGKDDKKEEKEEEVEEEDIVQKKGTLPSHETADYVGTYEDKGYGTIEVTSEKENELILEVRGFVTPLKHYHYDVFTLDGGILDGQKVQFRMNKDGDIDRVTMALQMGVSDIEFKKVQNVQALTKDAMELYVAEYELNGLVATVEINDKEELTLTIPGQPTYVLNAVKEHTFNIKDLEGYSVIFKVKEGVSTAAVFNQPNGVFTIPRKK